MRTLCSNKIQCSGDIVCITPIIKLTDCIDRTCHTVEKTVYFLKSDILASVEVFESHFKKHIFTQISTKQDNEYTTQKKTESAFTHSDHTLS